jgi:hypothetical protein
VSGLSKGAAAAAQLAVTTATPQRPQVAVRRGHSQHSMHSTTEKVFSHFAQTPIIGVVEAASIKRSSKQC